MKKVLIYIGSLIGCIAFTFLIFSLAGWYDIGVPPLVTALRFIVIVLLLYAIGFETVLLLKNK